VLHGCTLEDECRVEDGAVLNDNVVVEKHAIVGAGAILTSGKRVPSGQVIPRSVPFRLPSRAEALMVVSRAVGVGYARCGRAIRPSM
jgi:carbonic anhydrase/acetyltransferase-like protein (isoleucine patch superfamily)